MAVYTAKENRYETMQYRRCGESGVLLPLLSLGLWHNFGGLVPYENSREMVLGAFDLGIVHFDLANNYGPPPGSAESTFGRIMAQDLRPYRDELFISTKAGYSMWEGPYGNWGSKKSLLSSLDQSLSRMGLEYVDVFYHHRMDPETPLEESMEALATAVRQGKALYVGVSNYSPEETKRASKILKDMGIKALIHQPRYNMFAREPEEKLFGVLEKEGMGCIAYSSLAQGLLTDRYFNGIPADSRAGDKGLMSTEAITQEKVNQSVALAKLAHKRDQSLAQMALAWNLRNPGMTSLILGASRLSQIEENVKALENLSFTKQELDAIDTILAGEL